MSDSVYWSECPQVEPEHLHLAERQDPYTPPLVMFPGKKCWFKPVGTDNDVTVYSRRTDILVRIEKAGLLDLIRAPRLHGLVTSEKPNCIQGLLFGVPSTSEEPYGNEAMTPWLCESNGTTTLSKC